VYQVIQLLRFVFAFNNGGDDMASFKRTVCQSNPGGQLFFGGRLIQQLAGQDGAIPFVIVYVN